MKKYGKYILLAIAFVGILVAATLGYKALSDEYMPEDDIPPVSDNDDNSGSSDDVSDGTQTEPDDEKPEQLNTAPDFTVVDMNGNTVKLSDYFGKPIVVNFWGTWCPYCVQEFPHFQKIYEEYKDEVVFLMVNSGDTKSDAANFLSYYGYTFPAYLDTTNSAVSAYGVYNFPTTLFIGANGELAHRYAGAMSEQMLRSKMQYIVKSVG